VTEVSLAGCWLPSPATFPSSGFLTLLTVYSSRCLASLFRLTSTHGVHPPKHSPSTQPVRLSASRALLPLPPRVSPSCSAVFRALIHAKVRWLFVMFPSTKPPRCSHGLLLSKVFAFPAVASLSTGLLSPFGTSASTDRRSLSALVIASDSDPDQPVLGYLRIMGKRKVKRPQEGRQLSKETSRAAGD
jgi:hypothetical protein